MKPLVSVVLPIYNGQRYVRSAIQSVLDQTYPYFELLAVDDSSWDASVQEVESFSDPRLRLFKLTVNQGVSVAINTGLAAASGKYLTVLDDDDIWLPGRLEAMVQAMEEARPGYFVSDDVLDFSIPRRDRRPGCGNSETGLASG